ncbi:MAG: tetratricopeptide repeat protein [Bacteroidota bacterium]
MSSREHRILYFWQELKRRKVFRVLAMYAATAFIILEAADIMLPRLGLPDWIVTLLVIVVIAGFPITAIISWIYDITPEGLIRTEPSDSKEKKKSPHQPARRIINANNIVILILFAAVCVLLYPKIFNRDIPDVKAISDRKAISGRKAISDSIALPDSNPIDLIAVLPLTNTRSDPETDYLGFAIADQIIGNLAYLRHITVRSSGSVRKYEKQVIDPIAAGDSLKVDFVLSGNYLKEGNIIRLNVELVDVNTNEMIWREPIELDFKSTFELQDMVAQKVVEGLNVQFSQKELNRIGKDIPDDPLAYEYYLRSISYPYTNEGDQLAIQMLNKSIEIDSTFAPAYAQLADRLHRLAQFGLLDPEETKRSESLYLKAISLNEDLIFALANLAQIYTETARTEKALQLTKKILEINPNNAEAHFSLGYIYRYAGMNEEAIREMEKAVSLDSGNQGFRSIVLSYQCAGEYEKVLEKAKEYDQSSYMLSVQGETLFRQGKKDESLTYFNRGIAIAPDGLSALFAMGWKSVIEENFDEGLEAGRKFEKANILDAEAWYAQASIYGLLGDIESCKRCLQRTVNGGFFNYPFMLNDAFFDSVREDADFQKILLEAKEKHEAFKKRFSKMSLKES